MKKIVLLLLCCLAVVFVGSCSNDEGSKEAAKETEPAKVAEVTEAVDEVDIVGKWHVTEWKADEVDQIEMWGVGNLTVEFRADGSIESRLVYSNGEERSSKGAWKRDADNMEIVIKGGGGEEGDEPFERTREFTIEELTPGGFWVHATIGTADRPIVLTYKAQRLPAPQE